MNEFLLRIWNRVRTGWQNMTSARKAMWIGIPAVVIAAAVIIGLWATQPNYTALFSNLSPEDAGVIADQLAEQKIPYKLLDGGKTITVPSRMVYSTRISLATKGLPKGGGVGFEIFDRTNLGVTDFTQRVNFVRALEGELNRTIGHIDSIQAVSYTHLTLPTKRIV